MAPVLVRSAWPSVHTEQVNLARQASCCGRVRNGPVADERVLQDVLNATAAVWRERRPPGGRPERPLALRPALRGTPLYRPRGPTATGAPQFSPLRSRREYGAGVVDAPRGRAR